MSSLAISSASEHPTEAKLAIQVVCVTFYNLISHFSKILSVECTAINFRASVPASVSLKIRIAMRMIISLWPTDLSRVGCTWDDSDDRLWKYNHGLIDSRLRGVHNYHTHSFVALSFPLLRAVYKVLSTRCRACSAGNRGRLVVTTQILQIMWQRSTGTHPNLLRIWKHASGRKYGWQLCWCYNPAY